MSVNNGGATTTTTAATTGVGQEAVSSGNVISDCLSLLSRSDDTSRFVGLAMMLSIASHIQDPSDILGRCMETLNPIFLDRLLNAGQHNSVQSSSLVLLM